MREMLTFLFEGVTSNEQSSNYKYNPIQAKYMACYSLYNFIERKTLNSCGLAMNEGQPLTDQKPNFLWYRYK